MLFKHTETTYFFNIRRFFFSTHRIYLLCGLASGSFGAEPTAAESPLEVAHNKRHNDTVESDSTPNKDSSSPHSSSLSPSYRSVCESIYPHHASAFLSICFSINHYLQVHMQTQLHKNFDERLLVSNTYVPFLVLPQSTCRTRMMSKNPHMHVVVQANRD